MKQENRKVATIENSEYNRNLIEVSPDALVTIGPGGRIADVNLAMEEITGIMREELIGSVFSDYFTDSEKAMQGYELALEKGSVRDYLLEIRHADGKTTPVICNASVYEHDPDNVKYVFAAARDVTVLREAELSLRSVLEFNEKLSSASPIGIFTYDDSGQCTSANEAGCKITGTSLEQAVAQNFREIESWKKSTLLETAEKTLATGKQEEIEVWMVTTFGKHICIRCRTARFSSSERQHLLLIITDISKQKDVERQLLQAREDAEANNQAKSEFLANMSHEIRTPMNGILGFVDILGEEELTVEQQEAVQTIKKSGETLLALINDILDISKVESSELELETVPFDVEDLILNVGELMRSKLGEKPLEINCYVEDIHTNLLGDPTRLRQIITNLVGNAIKFTEQGEIAIEVRQSESKKPAEIEHMQDEDAEELVFSVRDTGIGIPEDKLDTIFESFKQVDGSTTRKYGGTGLGLTISRRLAQLMGGDIWVESPADYPLKNSPKDQDNRQSQAGPGSVFSFTAGFKKDKGGAEEIRLVDVSQLKGKPILIVDDNETALKVLKNIVERVGMTPVLARSGQEALGHFQTKDRAPTPKFQPPFEIVLSDIVMPGMSGYKLAAEIFRLTGGKTRMIALSAFAAPGSAKESQKSGFDGFLSKPVRPQVLIDLIRTVLGTRDKKPVNIATQHSVREVIKHDVKILYAEDNLINQKLGQKMFERMGYNKVKIAPDGLEAVKMIKENGPFDIIFMDIQMPNMGGLEATREIRKYEEELRVIHNSQSATHHLPIIALTANAMKGDREKCLDAGMDEYLSKPFKREEIQEMIKEWVPKR